MTPFQALMYGGGNGGPLPSLFYSQIFTGPTSSQKIFTPDVHLLTRGGVIMERYSDTAGYVYCVDHYRGLTNVQAITGAAQQSGYSMVTGMQDGSYTKGPFWNAEGLHSMVFAQDPKFFTVASYVGDSALYRDIPLNLTDDTGFFIVKNISTGAAWVCGFWDDKDLIMHFSTNQPTTKYSNYFDFSTAGRLRVTGINNYTNDVGSTYLVYAWAKGAFSSESPVYVNGATASGNTLNVSLPWKPSFVMVKNRATAGEYRVCTTATDAIGKEFLWTDSTTPRAKGITLTPTGFTITSGIAAGNLVSYMAIR